MTTGVAHRRARPRLRRPRAAGFVVVASLALSVLPGVARAGQTRVPGIDVSKWQGDVDWAAVASTDVRFVIIRSTIGDTGTTPLSVDPRYAEYVAGATGNGLVVGAYHRAHVGRTEGDAREEADWFTELARIEAGDVLPVLDIEETHGLSVGEMQEWVQTWVTRVYARTGVRPMVYTSPYFWRTAMGDTTWFASHGYPLWIAHWGVTEPDVPAQDWGGHGWTYWQWTSRGSVDGISTNVDRDRFRGSNLVHGTIASLTVTAPLGGAVTGARIRCGGGSTRCARLANPDTALTLTAAPDPGATVIGWTGACAAAGASPTCEILALGDKMTSVVFGFPLSVQLAGTGGGTVTSTPAGIECGADRTDCVETVPAGSSVTLEAVPDSASGFAGWGGACVGSAPTCTVEVSAITDVTARFDSLVTVEEIDPATTYAWGRALDARAIGGSYRWERRAGATTTFAFSGDAVTLYTITGRAMGKAQVDIDGTVVATLDGYAPSLTSSARRFAGLGPGAHELTVTVLGTKRIAATGTRVAVDALRWGGTLRRDPAGTATWASIAADAGTAAISEVPRATATLRFEGTGVSARVLRGPSMGEAELWVDGLSVRTVDLYAASTRTATIDVATGLADRAHVVRLIVLGTHRAASSGSAVALDAWVVR